MMNETPENLTPHPAPTKPPGNWWLVLAVFALTTMPLIFVEGEYGGADGEAAEVITEIHPDYEPWFSGIYEPPSSEIENLLFVSQAALGAGVIGYVVGLYKGRHAAKK